MLVVLIETLSFMVLYDAAFAALAQHVPDNTRAAITKLTLIAGFASTIFWPLTGWLGETLGWRGSYLAFAALNVAIALPLHFWLARQRADVSFGNAETASVRSTERPVLKGAIARRAFWQVGISFALSGMAIAALGVHMVPILLDRGLGETAFLVAMAMGPAQVLIRIVDATLWRRLHPVTVAVISAAALPLSMVVLLSPGPNLLLAAAFAVLFGAAQGLSSIVRGAVPVVLFGREDLGLQLGRLAAMRNILGAAAPFLFAFAGGFLGNRMTLWLTIGIATAGFLVIAWLWRDLGRAEMIATPEANPAHPIG